MTPTQWKLLGPEGQPNETARMCVCELWCIVCMWTHGKCFKSCLRAIRLRFANKVRHWSNHQSMSPIAKTSPNHEATCTGPSLPSQARLLWKSLARIQPVTPNAQEHDTKINAKSNRNETMHHVKSTRRWDSSHALIPQCWASSRHPRKTFQSVVPASSIHVG